MFEEEKKDDCDVDDGSIHSSQTIKLVNKTRLHSAPGPSVLPMIPEQSHDESSKSGSPTAISNVLNSSKDVKGRKGLRILSFGKRTSSEKKCLTSPHGIAESRSRNKNLLLRFRKSKNTVEQASPIVLASKAVEDIKEGMYDDARDDEATWCDNETQLTIEKTVPQVEYKKEIHDKRQLEENTASSLSFAASPSPTFHEHISTSDEPRPSVAAEARATSPKVNGSNVTEEEQVTTSASTILQQKKSVSLNLFPYLPNDVAKQGNDLIFSLLSGLSYSLETPKMIENKPSETPEISRMTKEGPELKLDQETSKEIQLNGKNIEKITTEQTITREAPPPVQRAELLSEKTGDDETIMSFASAYQRMDKKSLMKRLKEAERRQRTLEMQLKNSGLQVPEEIDFQTAKKEILRIAKRMQEIGSSNVTHDNKKQQDSLREEYFKLEQEMERYTSALTLTKEYQVEQAAIERRWEEQNAPLNDEALRKIRRHMPIRIRFMTERELTTTPSPNGKFLPPTLVKRFKRSNILQILRTDPNIIEKMHPAQLETYRVTGLTLTERRALHAHLRGLGPRWEKNKSDKVTARKLAWFNSLKESFKADLESYQRHVQEHFSIQSHSLKSTEKLTGCQLLGRKCPVRADMEADYSVNYGWPEGAVFETVAIDASANECTNELKREQANERERKAKDRMDALKNHYEGNPWLTSQANGVCETMDQVMDKMELAMARWIESTLGAGISSKHEVVDFTDALTDLKPSFNEICNKSGMETGGKNGNHVCTDLRSALECELAEEVYETSLEFFSYMIGRMNDLNIKDARITMTISTVQELLCELHKRNISRMKKLGAVRSRRSRKLKTVNHIRDDVIKRMKMNGTFTGSKPRVNMEQNDLRHSNTEETDISGSILAAIKARKKTSITGSRSDANDGSQHRILDPNRISSASFAKEVSGKAALLADIKMKRSGTGVP